MSDAIKPFHIAVDDAGLADLQERLARTRWPDRETVDDWTQAIPLAYMQEVRAYWGASYDWRTREKQLNQIPQFRTSLSGGGDEVLGFRRLYSMRHLSG